MVFDVTDNVNHMFPRYIFHYVYILDGTANGLCAGSDA